jgi:hypothetical protein
MTERLLLSGILAGLLLLTAGTSPRSPAPPPGRAPADTLPDAPRTVVLDQAEAPVRITAYEADYAGTRLFRSDGIRHEVDFRNAGDRRVVAVRFAFVMYSVFNDVIDDETGVVLDPLPDGERSDESWTHDPPDASTFHIGAAYVDKVRLADGTIWSADDAAISRQLDRIEAGQESTE